MDSLVFVKLACLITMLLITLGCALLPVYSSQVVPGSLRRKLGVSTLDAMSALAAGVFLVTGIVSVLSESMESLKPSNALSLACLGFFLTLIIETVVAERTGLTASRDAIIVLVLSTALSFHSVLEGAAVGFESTRERATFLTASILPHKVTAALALGTMHRQAVDKSPKSAQTLVSFYSLIAYAVASPFGGFVATLLTSTVDMSPTFTACLMATTSGTFLYVAIVDLMMPVINKAAGGRLSHSHGGVDSEEKEADHDRGALADGGMFAMTPLRVVIAMVILGATVAWAAGMLVHGGGGHSHSHGGHGSDAHAGHAHGAGDAHAHGHGELARPFAPRVHE